MRRVGTADIEPTVCGFAPEPDSAVCGKSSALHGIIGDTWEDISFLMACADHAGSLDRIADYTHAVQPECFDPDAHWLTRWDGRSFCYSPEDDAALKAELARPEIAWSAKP